MIFPWANIVAIWPSTELLEYPSQSYYPWYFHIIPLSHFSHFFGKKSLLSIFWFSFLFSSDKIFLCAKSFIKDRECSPWLSGAVHVVVDVVFLSCPPSTPLPTSLLLTDVFTICIYQTTKKTQKKCNWKKYEFASNHLWHGNARRWGLSLLPDHVRPSCVFLAYLLFCNKWDAF